MIIIFIGILYTAYMITDLFYLLRNHDDEQYIDLLINLVREEKIKILDSKDKTIINKVKYILKLGKYS